MCEVNNAMNKNICLVLGDIFIDVYLSTMSMPLAGAHQPVQKADFRLGGSGCVTALSLHALGTPVLLAGNVGDDNLGEYILEHIRQLGVDDHFIQRHPNGQTGFFMTVQSFGGELTLLTTRGVNDITLALEPLSKALEKCAHLHISGYMLHGEEQYEIARSLAEIACLRGLSVSLDPGVCSSRNRAERVLGILPMVNFFLPNRTELLALTGQSETEKALEQLMKGYGGCVALKLDAEGSRYVNGRMDVGVPVKEIPKTDYSIGAGDGFNAGFLHSILNRQPPIEALKAGNEMAVRMINSNKGVIDLIKAKVKQQE